MITGNMGHSAYDRSMEVLCTIPTWPSYVTSVMVCRDFDLDIDTLHNVVRDLRARGMAIHRASGKCGETLSVLFNNSLRTEQECLNYWQKVYGDEWNTKPTTNPRLKRLNRG